MAFMKETLVILHIVAGAAALLLFWIPAFTKKGGRAHIAVGRYYVTAMYVVCATAVLACGLVIADPLAVQRPGEVFEPTESAALADR